MRTTWLLAWLALPAPARGQPAPAGTPVLTAAGAFFALSVADLEASTRWYAEKLGLAVVMREPKQGGAAVAVLEGGGLVVELVARDGAVPLGTAAPGRGALDVHGIFKAGVVVADYDRALAALRARGVPIVIGPFPATATRRANFIFRDGAGNLIQVIGGYAGRPR
jgi:catechol 2,3-dioxygenase-like lactoylglutathione lyase family enzyme